MLTRSVPLAEFSLVGPDVEPRADLAWHRAPASEKAAYFNELARLASESRVAANLAAEDWEGGRMTPRLHPRPDGAAGPVFSPHWRDSRSNTEIRYKGTE